MRINDFVTYHDVAKKIVDKNIIAIFQGRSEAGPRALGNRSMLYTPLDVNGKTYVNTVKGREQFRPLAGTILKEYANDWFDMIGIDESPHMTFSFNVRPDKAKLIPTIIHEDGSCRIQTVTEEYNPHYYLLIKAFYELTSVPLLLNTSLNTAREPIVETIENAFTTFVDSKIDCLYLPELQYLIEK